MIFLEYRIPISLVIVYFFFLILTEDMLTDFSSGREEGDRGRGGDRERNTYVKEKH